MVEHQGHSIQKMKESEFDWQKYHEDHMKHWRAWGSWFSWGSPVGLGIFFVLFFGSVSGSLWLLALTFHW